MTEQVPSNVIPVAPLTWLCDAFIVEEAKGKHDVEQDETLQEEVNEEKEKEEAEGEQAFHEVLPVAFVTSPHPFSSV